MKSRSLKFKVLLVMISFFQLGLTTKAGSKLNGFILEDSTLQESIAVYNFNELESLLYTEEDKTYLINFWAMWCAPCVKELPHILEFSENNPDVEIILVSMDFPEGIETKLKPFLLENNINLKVVLLDDPDANSWIDKVNPDWSGAIPYTIAFDNNERVYFEGSFENAQQIEEFIKSKNI